MKIALVLNTSWNVVNFRMGLIRALHAAGHEVCVLAPRDDYSEAIINAGCEFQHIRMDSRGVNPVKDAGLIMELYLAYKKLLPDVILHFTIKPNIYGSIAAAWCGIPTINNVSGLGTVFLKETMVTQVARQLYRYSFRFPARVFFQNDEDRALFLEQQLMDEARTDLLPGSGINTTHFSPAKAPANTTFTFLLIARLIYDKGIQEYIDAIALLREKKVDAHFQLLGAKDPAHKRGIPSALIDQWADTGMVEYLGTAADVREFINRADCIVLPSYREGTPRTLLEASSHAKPIVATDVPGCRHVVEAGKNGLLCQPRSAKDLADKMEEMLSLPLERRNEMGAYGRQKIEREFDEELVITKYIEAIESLEPLIHEDR